MQEDDGRTRSVHVMMNGYHTNAMHTKRLENPIYFVFEHSHIACHSRILIVPNEGGPRVQAHASVDQSSHFFELQIVAANRYLINGPILLSFIPHDFCDLGCIDLARLQSRCTGGFGVRRFYVADQVNGRLHLPRQIRETCMTHHVHEKYARLVEEEMIVQCGY